jgi:hypothetical protein
MIGEECANPFPLGFALIKDVRYQLIDLKGCLQKSFTIFSPKNM